MTPTRPTTSVNARRASAGSRRHHLQSFSGLLTGPRLDRLARAEPAQLLGQDVRAGVPPGRILLQALEADRDHVARQFRPQLRGDGRHGRLDLLQGLEHRGGLEGRAAGEQLVEDRPERVDVGRGSDHVRLPPACSGAM